MRLALILVAALALVACGPATPVFDSTQAVLAATYVDDGPPSITLLTTQNTRSGAGAHTALMINASQRVMYDPAGSFVHPSVPEQDDLKYGITDNVLNTYLDFHSRDTFRVVEHTVLVSPAVAELALQRARVQGAAPSAYCANYTSELLRGLPGFEGLPQTFYPNILSEAFAGLPGTQSRVVTNDMVRGLHNSIMVEPGETPPR